MHMNETETHTHAHVCLQETKTGLVNILTKRESRVHEFHCDSTQEVDCNGISEFTGSHQVDASGQTDVK